MLKANHPVKANELPENMHLKEPRQDALLAEHMNPTSCPIHRYKLSTSETGQKFCPKCASEALKQQQADKIRTDSATVARSGR